MSDDDDVRPSVSEAPEYDGQIHPEAPEEPAAAHDGEPKEEEGGNVTPFPGRRGKSAEELVGGGPTELVEEEEEDDGQFTFVVEEKGKQLRFSDLLKRGTPVEYEYKLQGKAMSSVSGGLIDPYAASHVIVSETVVDNVKEQFIRDEDGKVEKVILYVTLKPRIIQQAFSEAGQHLLTEASKAAGVRVTFETAADAA